jgi:predicted 2-oxoglutarate/Fe(II)-dependent dioxygenase YbiX
VVHTSSSPHAPGDRAPEIVGATASGRLYASETQAGRPSLVVGLDGLSPDRLRHALAVLRSAALALAAAGVDPVPLAPPAEHVISLLAADPLADDEVVYADAAAPFAAVDGHAVARLLDRNRRIVAELALTPDTDLAAWLAAWTPRVAFEPAQVRAAAAPVLVIPNVAPRALCEALIALFEASPHEPGVMASVADGAPYAKLDESKKRRRDFELAPGAPLHDEVLRLFARRVAPEIKRAFQAEVVHADRILLARYDETGGWFKRHRDDAAPHTAFREFAISLNLNTHDYEGGELLFPEFDDHRYSPPAGAAIVFSASLLHEAAPVTKGRRYVLLSFLSSAAAQAKLDAWKARQGAAA